MAHGIKRAIKNSAFTLRFSGRKHVMELRRALHLEDDAATPRLRRSALVSGLYDNFGAEAAPCWAKSSPPRGRRIGGKARFA